MKKEKLLTEKEVKKCLKQHPDWVVNLKQTQFQIVLNFDNHITALIMVARITVYAEVQQHHPDVQFTYKKLKIKVSTHDANGLTKKDIKLMEKIDQLRNGRA